MAKVKMQLKMLISFPQGSRGKDKWKIIILKNKQYRQCNSLGLVSPCGFHQFVVERGIRTKLQHLVQLPLVQGENAGMNSGMFMCVSEIGSACKSSALGKAALQCCTGAATLQQYCTPGPKY